MHLLVVLGLLVSGSLLTSLAEYKFQYNLFGYIVEGFKTLLGYETKAELFARALENEVHRRVTVALAELKALEKRL